MTWIDLTPFPLQNSCYVCCPRPTTKCACQKHAYPFRNSIKFSFPPVLTTLNPLPPTMIDFDQHRVLSPLSSSSSDVLIHDSKFPSSTHFYLRQQHTVQIIQLVEGPPPSPRRISSVINGSAASSSSQYSSQDSESSDGDDEESVCSSYCSSDLPPQQQPQSPPCDDDSNLRTPGPSSQSYSLPLKRILAWREDFSIPLSTTLSGM